MRMNYIIAVQNWNGKQRKTLSFGPKLEDSPNLDPQAPLTVDHVAEIITNYQQLPIINCWQAPLTVDHVAERITKLASSATKAMSGQFLDFDGELIPYWSVLE